jgi:hypothetical protein
MPALLAFQDLISSSSSTVIAWASRLPVHRTGNTVITATLQRQLA